MCDKCSELDKKIEHLQTLAQRVLDQMTTDGIAELVRELRGGEEKAASGSKVTPNGHGKIVRH